MAPFLLVYESSYSDYYSGAYIHCSMNLFITSALCSIVTLAWSNFKCKSTSNSCTISLTFSLLACKAIFHNVSIPSNYSNFNTLIFFFLTSMFSSALLIDLKYFWNTFTRLTDTWLMFTSFGLQRILEKINFFSSSVKICCSI